MAIFSLKVTKIAQRLRVRPYIPMVSDSLGFRRQALVCVTRELQQFAQHATKMRLFHAK